MSLDVWLTDKSGDVLWDHNITHNLNTMAGEAKVYKHIWRPEEVRPKIKKAGDLIEPLTKALADMEANPLRFMKWAPPNGWGTFATLKGFIESYLNACKKWPDAEIYVSR